MSTEVKFVHTPIIYSLKRVPHPQTRELVPILDERYLKDRDTAEDAWAALKEALLAEPSGSIGKVDSHMQVLEIPDVRPKLEVVSNET